MRLKSFDNYLITLMGLFALISLYKLYWIKYFPSSRVEPQVKVASIVEQIKTVKHKRDFYQSWADVNPGDGLSQNDEIYTHEQSSAKINFVKGPQINLFENSLLRIKTVNKENILNLERGNLTAKLSKDSPKLDLVLGGKKYSFESQNANIQIEQGPIENKFLLLEGKAKLVTAKISQEINSNQIIILNKETGGLKIEHRPFILKTPPHNSVNYVGKDIVMDFSWSYTSLTSPAKILVAKNSNFKDIILSNTISENQTRSVFDEAGTYYWKLVSNDGIESEIRTFTLIEEQPLSLLLDKNILYKGPKITEKAFISWNSDKAKRFLLKIEYPNKHIEEINLVTNNFQLPAVATGIYHVSVKVNEKNRPNAIWSWPSSIEVLEAKAINITSNMERIIEKVNYNQEAISHLLSWNGPSSGVNYKISLIKDNKIQKFQTENTSILINLKEIGDYKWEIQGETPSGITSNALAGNIVIKSPLQLIQTPSEGAVIELDKPDQLVVFKWNQVPNTKEYQFELSNDRSFTKKIYSKDIITNNISTIVAQTGKYFWRVKIKKENSVEYSTPASVEIKPTPPLPRPEVLPNIKIKLRYLEDKTSNIHWSDFFIGKVFAADQITVAEWDLPANARAKEYIVEIYQDPELTHLVFKIETTVPHIVWKNAIPGNFYWRVSYVDYWGRKTEFSKASTLLTEPDQLPIELPAPLKETLPPMEAPIEPIELKTPKHKADILDKDGDEFLFTWADVPNAKSYQFIIASNLDFEKPLINTKTNSPKIKIKCIDLNHKEDEYYWKVTSSLGNTSKRRMFHISCAPKKVEPPIIIPSPAETITKSPVQNLKIPEEKKSLHYTRLGLFPHKLTYTNSSSEYSSKVSGNALTSIFAMYHRPVDWRYIQSFTPTIWVSRGKVFNTITFTDFELNLKTANFQSMFSWGPVLSMIKKTLYIESNQTITGQGYSSPLFGVFIQKEIRNFFINAELKFGAMLDYHADLQYAFKNKISLGIFYDATSMTKDSSKHSFSRMGLNLNYTFAFLDVAK